MERSSARPDVHDTDYGSLYSFGARADGRTPEASLVNVNGTLYGTTYGGGKFGYYGTIFSFSMSGIEKVLHSFGAGSDGANPVGDLIDVNGTLYGTTENGGAYGSGTVFRISTTGIEKVLYSFGQDFSDGANPVAGLINVNGKLYGTTYEGGTYSNGTVFRISQTGKEHVMYSFGYAYDGANPLAPLVYAQGRLYGTTIFGGTSMPYPGGTVFRITLTGKEKVLHDFGNRHDGAYPWAGLTYARNKLYGTTESGGTRNAGTVFSITLSGAEKVLHDFSGPDGKYPYSRLLKVNDTLYGTTFTGGGYKCDRGESCGTVFSMTTEGAESVLHTFGTYLDGAGPYSSLIEVKGTLYGTTAKGGAHNHEKGGDGTVFALTL